jgi:hypothetical protein
LNDDGSILFSWDGRYQGTTNVTIEISDGINTVYANVLVSMEEDSGESSDGGNDLVTGQLLGFIGIVLVIFAVFLLFFMIVKRSPGADLVEEEIAEADRLYEKDMNDLEG